ncbi:MAG: DNA mismatch repair endonuclease MutL [Clostridiales bacterium]|nr:DNA mismatch repair endonuclease MutL [Clostridiales bacterium]
MSRINLLDSSVYNQISAGEVVDNPSSVVKELVENSIDAGASEITIMIEDGGIKSISVIDNGHGIESDDLPKTVLPHATSKIATTKDLLTISTLGFRGEALASIAAVSEVTIKSKYIASDYAYEYIIKGGQTVGHNITNLAKGTSITVNNLFFNTPARYKFLKTKKGEERKVTKLVQDFVFSNPDIAFKYYADNNLVYQTTGDGLKNAMYAVYSSDIADNMVYFNLTDKNHTASGFAALPATSAIYSNKSRQHIIINSRIIEDNALSMVIQNAYGDKLMKRTFPTIIVDIVMPFELVDVNVHPSKKEVRFARAKQVYSLVYNAIKNALDNEIQQRQEKLFKTTFHQDTEKEIKEVLSTTDSHSQYFNPTPINYKDATFSTDLDIYKYSYVAKLKNDKDIFESIDEIELRDNIDSVKEFFTNVENEQNKDNYNIIGQLFDTYILIEYNNALMLIDQHAAHERILYNKLLTENKQDLVAQELLFPYSANVPKEAMDIIAENIEVFNNLGFEINLEDDKINLTAIPFMLINMDIDSFLSELIEDASVFGQITNINQIEEKIAQKACKSAIKSGDKLSGAQLDFVINYFIEKGMPLQCPHGRPTIIKFTKQEIEKLFRRIV